MKTQEFREFFAQGTVWCEVFYVHVLMDINIEMILVGRIDHSFVYKLLICIYNGLHSCTLHMVGLYAIYK